MPARDTLLRIYLNDHLAGSAMGLALARRTLRSNPEGELGEFLRRLVTQIEEDRAALERVMQALGVRANPAKMQAARLLEVVGRLKLNGRLRGYSDLSRVLELEGLSLGIAGKHALWTSLAETGRDLPVDLDALIRRADEQRDAVERHRLDAVRRAFRTGT